MTVRRKLGTPDPLEVIPHAWKIRELKSRARKPAQLSSTGSGFLKRAENALRDSEKRLRAALESAAEGIITIDERRITPEADLHFGDKSVEFNRCRIAN